MSPVTPEDPLYDVFTGPDTEVIAKHLRESGKKTKKQQIPDSARITNAITSVSMSDTMKGASTLTIVLKDPEYDLIDSGFFDPNKDGKLDPIDIEYPENSEDWWRVTQVGVDDQGGGPQITLTAMERAAAHLASHKGPLKVSRGKRTRAEFLKMCSGTVKAAGGIHFHCQELHEKQQIGEGEIDPDFPDQPTRKKPKKPEPKAKKAGIHKDETELTVKGQKATSSQIAIANTGLEVAADLGAPPKACLALLVAYIQESGMANLDKGDRDSLGVLQVRVSTSGSASKSKDVEWCTRKFLQDGFWGKGGAIEIAKAHPDQDAGWIAQQAQGSGYPSAYAPHLPEARKFLEAFGGAGLTGSAGATKKYNFEIGTTDNPNEDIWAGMNRIAEEVKWPLFLNGQHLYYDSELTLIKQKPALVLKRGDASLITYEYNWDTRQIATEMTLDLICDPDEFRAGQVFKLVGFGPASKSSTAAPDPLPGRWLVSEIERDMTSVFSSFTLKQPETPLKEPKAEAETKGGEDGSTDAGPVRDKIVSIAKDSMTNNLFYSQSGATTAKVHPSRGERSDCSQWARAVYLTAGAGDPGTYTGAMLARGKHTDNPKPGDLLCSPSHVELFIGDGKTIGHGSPPIDEDTVAAVKGRDAAMKFITFDFLDK